MPRSSKSKSLSNKSKVSGSDRELLKYLDAAVKLEKSSVKFYTTARDKIDNFNMKSLLNAFLTVEVEHLRKVKAVRDLVRQKKTAQAVKEAKKFKAATPKNPFKDMVQWKKLTGERSDIRKLFDGAVDLETDAEEFYKEAASHANNPELRKFLLRFAKDEARHRKFLKEHEDAVYDDGYWLGIGHVRLQT